MRRAGLRGAYILAACGWAACHHASPGPTTSADRQGVYQFSEHVTANGAAGESIDIEGQATVLADSVMVDARPGPCRFDPTVTSPGPFVYDCGNVRLTFDRRDPVQRSSYTATLAQNESRQVCARYATEVGGRSTCVEWRTETTQRLAKRSGSLRLLRVPD